MHINLAHIAGAQVAIALGNEGRGSARIVSRLSCQGGGRDHEVSRRTDAHNQTEKYSYGKIPDTH